jgi:hypothetical protein
MFLENKKSCTLSLHEMKFTKVDSLPSACFTKYSYNINHFHSAYLLLDERTPQQIGQHREKKKKKNID